MGTSITIKMLYDILKITNENTIVSGCYCSELSVKAP